MAERRQIERRGSLPYCFKYKMRAAFTGKKCPVCGCIMNVDREFGLRTRIPSIQHNIPISLGGKHDVENISIICKKCNVTIKANKTGSLNNSEVVSIWNKIKESK